MNRKAMMRLLTIAILLALSLAASPARAQYVAGFEDLPLAPGLAMVDGSALSFDKPEGRIVEAVAAGRTTDRAKVGAFDRDTLHHLGWRETAARRGGGTWNLLQFQRDDEQLAIMLDGHDGRVEVRYQLSPKQGR
jgi:hypothetical protein